jgi:hypothetical protein
MSYVPKERTMHPTKLLTALFTALTTLAFVPSQALAQSLLIDDFTTGSYQADAFPSAPDTHFQSGAMLGGARGTSLSTTSSLPQHQRPASLFIPQGGPLILETGFQVTHRLELLYGWNSSGTQSPLNLDARGYNRIRVFFDGLDQTENFNIVFWSAGGARYYQLGINASGLPRSFCIDFPFANFGSGGVPEADLADIDYMAFIFQTGTPMGGTDFALRSASLIGPSGVGSASCTQAHW